MYPSGAQADDEEEKEEYYYYGKSIDMKYTS